MKPSYACLALVLQDFIQELLYVGAQYILAKVIAQQLIGAVEGEYHVRLEKRRLLRTTLFLLPAKYAAL